MENICDRILELDNGRCEGPPRDWGLCRLCCRSSRPASPGVCTRCFMHDFGGAGAYRLYKEAREFRRKTQANAAADARTLFRREAEW